MNLQKTFFLAQSISKVRQSNDDVDDERTCPKVKDVYITKAVLIKQKRVIFI